MPPHSLHSPLSAALGARDCAPHAYLWAVITRRRTTLDGPLDGICPAFICVHTHYGFGDRFGACVSGLIAPMVRRLREHQLVTRALGSVCRILRCVCAAEGVRLSVCVCVCIYGPWGWCETDRVLFLVIIAYFTTAYVRRRRRRQVGPKMRWHFYLIKRRDYFTVP